MNIHEYQAKKLLAKYGVPVPNGHVAYTAPEAENVAKNLAKGMGDNPVWVVKAQIHAGGRGKGGGVKVVKSIEEVRAAADKMLGMTLVTHQTGPAGKEVKRVYIEEGCDIARELYISALVDRVTSRITFMASTEGGMDIEEVAAKTPEKIVMASGNAGKIKEIAHLLAHLDVSIVPQSDFAVSEAIETGSTFTENAIIKARHAAAATGLPAIADDSGLSVEALNGKPGVHSARYAGEHASDDSNIDKLLDELHGLPRQQRSAAFHCVACFVLTADAEPLLAKGEWNGHILEARQGDGGFGYDSVFLDPESGKASAELTPQEKNARSHRGKAARQLSELLGSGEFVSNTD